MTTLPRLLFISPVFPDVTGFGLAMRAGSILEALSTLCEVHLLIVPIHDPRGPEALAPSLSWSVQQRVVPIPRLRRAWLAAGGWARNHDVPNEWRLASARTVQQAARAFQSIGFEYIHVFRLYMMPFAEPYLREHSTSLLDLDDIESITRRRLAELYRANGLQAQAQREEGAAQFYAQVEQDCLPRFDGIFVCSPKDKEKFGTDGLERRVFVLPNTVRPAAALQGRDRGDPFNFLFVGNLAYYPNEDAVIYFLEQIMPLLRQNAHRPFRVNIVGAGSKRLRRFRHIPELRKFSFVSDVAPHYRDADAAIVPLRAGGGTRIKVLEAFSFGVPVVATPIGVEGLEVENEKQALIADNPAAFAEQCCRLMEDGPLCEGLTVNARLCLAENYTPEILRATLRQTYSAVQPSRT